MGLFMHPGPQTLQCWAWVQLVLGTEESWGLEFLRERRNCKEETLRRQIAGQLRTELGVPVFDVDVLISINANSPSLQELLLNVIFPWMRFNTGQTSETEQEATPPTGGFLAPAGPSPNQAALLSDVTLMPSESRPPAFKTGLFHTSKQRKLPTPQNAESHSESEQ